MEKILTSPIWNRIQDPDSGQPLEVEPHPHTSKVSTGQFMGQLGQCKYSMSIWRGSICLLFGARTLERSMTWQLSRSCLMIDAIEVFRTWDSISIYHHCSWEPNGYLYPSIPLRFDVSWLSPQDFPAFIFMYARIWYGMLLRGFLMI